MYKQLQYLFDKAKKYFVYLFWMRKKIFKFYVKLGKVNIFLKYNMLELNATFITQQEKNYEILCKRIFDKYRKIKVYRIYFSRIGEAVARITDVMWEMEQVLANNEEENLYVFMAGTPICNYALLNMLGRRINVVDSRTICFWQYVFQHYPERVDTSELMRHNIRIKREYDFSSIPSPLYFTEEEELIGAKALEEMGVVKEFVCIHARTEQYLKILQGESNKETAYHSYRDSDISYLFRSARALGNLGIQVIRVGAFPESQIYQENIIDYSFKYRTELLDLYLQAKCKFYLGTPNGTAQIASLFSTPVACVNLAPLGGFQSIPFNKFDLFIPKKIYSKAFGRLLNLEEMMEAYHVCGYNGRLYAEHGYEMIENTEEEILELAIEMNDSIDGKAQYDHTDTMLQERFRQLYNAQCDKYKIDISDRVPYRIGRQFLRQNEFLLGF